MQKRNRVSETMIGLINLIGSIVFGSYTLEFFGFGIELFRRSRDGTTPKVQAHNALSALEQSETNLRNALKAIEQMKRESEAEQVRLESLAKEADTTRRDLEDILKDHALAQELRAKDKDALRRSLGLVEIERAIKKGKISGFITGVLASLVAALVFLGGSMLYERFAKSSTDIQPVPQDIIRSVTP